MIVAITGTGAPFVRLVTALATYALAHPAEQVWIQHGSTPLPSNVIGESLLPRSKLMQIMDQADIIVCHGGSGAISDALSLGHWPVIVPRRHHLGEHINDHQMELASRLEAEGRAIVVTDVATLDDSIGRARASGRRAAPTATSRLATAVRRDAQRLQQRNAGKLVSRARASWTILRVLTAFVPRNQVR